jgi:ubiquinone/menaquinone biosynthesis C-methylase UbiE
LDVEDFAKLLVADDRKEWQDPEKIFDQIGILKGMTVADLGCGPGYFAIPLARRLGSGGKVYAIDENQVMLRHLAQNENRATVGEKAEIVKIESDVCNTKLPDASIDLAIFANLLHDLPDKRSFLNEVKRILKPCGLIVDVDWHKMNTNDMGPPIDWRLSENESRKILRESELRIVHALNAGPYHYGFVVQRANDVSPGKN